MRSCLKLFCVFALSLPFGCVFAKSHTLKKGETLAAVARKYYGEPVFGPKGTIKKIYKLNPWAEKSPNTVEPGTEVIIADGDANFEKPEKSAAVPTPTSVPIPPPATTLTSPPTPPPKIDGNAIVAEEKKSWDQKKVEDANTNAAMAEKKPEVVCPEAPKCEDCSKAQSTATLESNERLTFAQANDFFIVPFYSMSKISLTNLTTGLAYDLTSSSSFGARLGWDHKFNKTFSGLFEANTMIWNTGTTNTTSGANVVDKLTLYKVEFSLLNQVGEHSRFGLGFAYGNKVFIENFDATPTNETSVTFTGLDPVVTAEISLYHGAAFEMPLILKWSPLAADLDKGIVPGIKPGNEYTARLNFVHKLMSTNVVWGLSYVTNDQAENGRTQKRTDTNLELGMDF